MLPPSGSLSRRKDQWEMKSDKLRIIIIAIHSTWRLLFTRVLAPLSMLTNKKTPTKVDVKSFIFNEYVALIRQGKPIFIS